MDTNCAALQSDIFFVSYIPDLLHKWAIPRDEINFQSFIPSASIVYSMQHYVLKFVSDLCQVGGFLHQ